MAHRATTPAPRITPQAREPKAQLNVRIFASTLTLVRDYATFIDSTLDYTVNAALRLALDEDRAFQTWRETRVAPAVAGPHENIDARTRAEESC